MVFDGNLKFTVYYLTAYMKPLCPPSFKIPWFCERTLKQGGNETKEAKNEEIDGGEPTGSDKMCQIRAF